METTLKITLLWKCVQFQESKVTPMPARGSPAGGSLDLAQSAQVDPF